MKHEKLIQIVSYILSKYGGALNYTKLIKLLYLADRKAFAQCGYSITGDTYVSMKNGPVLSGLYDLIKNKAADKSLQKYWNANFQTTDYDVRTAHDIKSYGKLSDFEMETLDRIDAQFHNFTYLEMIDYVHDPKNCPEWQETTSSIPLLKSEILKKLGFSDKEIRLMQEEDDFYKAEEMLLKSLETPVHRREVCYD